MVDIIKASGEVEPFDPEKLLSSLKRSGASEELAQKVLENILPEITSNTKTKTIYRLAYRELKRLNHTSSLRYSLKKAIFRLGPTGYPFEKYFAELLKSYGYKTDVGLIIDGRCIKHEVDVLAVNESEVMVIECKYHNSPGRTTNSRDALYVHSRFEDLRPMIEQQYKGKKFTGYLVTNTRFSTDAIKYAECSGYKLIGWKYPHGGGLERMVEDQRLYPVTIISGIQKRLSEVLIKKGFILLKDILSMDIERLQTILGIPYHNVKKLREKAELLCGRTK
ncbi:MAG: ATPase [Nitrospirae bacterium]|nr:ATPase [Nitrospirota bacterium]